MSGAGHPTLGTIPGPVAGPAADPPAGGVPSPARPVARRFRGPGRTLGADGSPGLRASARAAGGGRLRESLPQRSPAGRDCTQAVARDGQRPHARRARHRRAQPRSWSACAPRTPSGSTTTPTSWSGSWPRRPGSTPARTATTSWGPWPCSWSRIPGSGGAICEVEASIKEGPGGRVGALVLPDGRRITLGAEPFVIGRLADCDLPIEDPLASRRHAEIRPEPDAYRLVDLGSLNGTMVNTARREEPRADGRRPDRHRRSGHSVRGFVAAEEHRVRGPAHRPEVLLSRAALPVPVPGGADRPVGAEAGEDAGARGRGRGRAPRRGARREEGAQDAGGPSSTCSSPRPGTARCTRSATR